METLEIEETPATLLYRRELPNLNDEPAWPQLLEAWTADYQPDSPVFEQHVLRAAQADLLLRQEERRFDLAHAGWLKKQKDVTQWDAKQNKAYREMKWRVDDAGRTLLRWTGLVERLRRSRLIERASAESRRHKSQQNSGASAHRQPILTPPASLPYMQIITVRIDNGVTRTIYNPPTRDVLDRIEVTRREGVPVRRVLHFQHGIPPEYTWARSEDGNDDPRHLEWSLSQSEFAAEVEIENKAGKGHVLKSKNLPVREVVLLD